jgi:ribosome biogenesis GTPase
MEQQKPITGVVSEVFPNQCNVILDQDQGKKLLCTYRRSQFLNKKSEWRERSPVAPGDLVEIKVLGSKDGVVENLIPRKNKIQRKAPGREGQVLHTIAANVDQVVIVSAFQDPPFSPGLIDRFLIATQQEQIVPLIVINKMDLSGSNLSPEQKPWKLYEDMGYQCFPVSAHDPESLVKIREKIQGKTSVFCGHSGVGKTSLLQELFGQKIGKVGSVNTFTGKGKHTTTVSLLLQPEPGTRFIDTPGIKEFGIFGITPNELIQHFPELYEVQLERKSIEDLPRYQSYLRIKQGLEDENR